MKKIRNLLMILFMVCVIAVPGSVAHADNDNVRPRKVTKIASSRKTIRVGDEFELKARLSPSTADDDYLRWSIVGRKGVIRFDDNCNGDDEAEFRAVKAGTTKVRCSVSGRARKYSKTFTVTVKKKKADYSIKRIGGKTITVAKGDDFDLEVKKSSALKNSQLKWTVKNTKYVGYDDSRYGDDIELIAKKVGKTTVTCKNLKTKQTITYTVQVVDYGDYDDDDDYDYDDDDYYNYYGNHNYGNHNYGNHNYGSHHYEYHNYCGNNYCGNNYCGRY